MKPQQATMRISKKSNNSEELFEQIERLKTFCGLGIQNSDGDGSNVDVKRAHKVKEVIFFSAIKIGIEFLSTFGDNLNFS